MNELLITCPKCFAAEPIKVVWSNGSPGMHTMPNGDPGYPGEPGGIEAIEADCSCWPDSWWDEPNTEVLLEALIGAFQAFAYDAQAEDFEAAE